MWHRLALGLGGRSIGEWQHSMGAGEFADWCSYWREEPWGSWRDNMHSAVLTAAVINSTPGRKKAVRPDDFMLKSRDAKRVATTLKALSALRALAKRT